MPVHFHLPWNANLLSQPGQQQVTPLVYTHTAVKDSAKKGKNMSFSFNVKAFSLTHTRACTRDGKEIKLACTHAQVHTMSEFINSCTLKFLTHAHTKIQPNRQMLATKKLQLTRKLWFIDISQVLYHSRSVAPNSTHTNTQTDGIHAHGALSLSSPNALILGQQRLVCPVMSGNLAVFLQLCPPGSHQMSPSVGPFCPAADEVGP